MKKRIGIIGYGNMGSAIAERIKSVYEVTVFDKDKNKIKPVSGMRITASAQDLVKANEVVILAVKPQDFEGLLKEIKDYAKGKLIISIAAGITTAYIEKVLGKVKVIRVMPNLPAKIGEGMVCLCEGNFASKDELDFAKSLFDYLGETLFIKETQMNAATAISGSGPGFFCDLVEGKSLGEIKDFSERYFIPSLITTATNLAFTPTQAEILATTTGQGTVRYLIKENLSPDEVKKQVASPGGTTEAGLGVLLHDIKNLEKAIKAALERAKELSREE